MKNPGSPFKYNSEWDKLICFQELVRKNWRHIYDGRGYACIHIVESLRFMKSVVVKWNLERRNLCDARLVGIEKDLKALYGKSFCFFSL